MKVARPERAAGNCGKFEAAMIDLSNKFGLRTGYSEDDLGLVDLAEPEGCCGNGNLGNDNIGKIGKIGERTKG